MRFPEEFKCLHRISDSNAPELSVRQGSKQVIPDVILVVYDQDATRLGTNGKFR